MLSFCSLVVCIAGILGFIPARIHSTLSFYVQPKLTETVIAFWMICFCAKTNKFHLFTFRVEEYYWVDLAVIFGKVHLSCGCCLTKNLNCSLYWISVFKTWPHYKSPFLTISIYQESNTPLDMGILCILLRFDCSKQTITSTRNQKCFILIYKIFD